ncbi:MAG: DNA translocase FtsK [Clostridia bacterium]|nr:DNA translocase FtsK [Clostridia bacterium]
MAEPKKNSKKSTAKKPSSAKKKTTTKKSSAKKAAPEKTGMDRGLKNTLWGIVFIAMALLTFLCFFDGVIGPVGSGLKVALCWAMGATAIGVPLFFLVLAVFRIMDRKAVVGKRIWGLIGLYATVSTLWSALSVELNGIGFTDYVATLAGKGLDMVGGGAVTSPLAWLSLSLLNKIGTIIVCIFIILILLVFLSGVTFATLFDRKPEEEEPEETEEEEPRQMPLFPLFGGKKKKSKKEPEVQDEGVREAPRKKAFEIPSIDPEETLTPAERRRMKERQLERDGEIDSPRHAEPEASRKEVVLSSDLIDTAPRKVKKEQNFEFTPDMLESPAAIDTKARMLMEEEAAANLPEEPEKISKEEIRAEAGQMAAEIKKEAEKEIPYVYPPLSLLTFKPDENAAKAKEELRQTAQNLMQALQNFSVDTTYLDAVRGPTVTRYELQPNAGVKISKITNLADDIALHLAASGVRIEAPIPGRSAIGIEIPNKVASIVYLKETISGDAFRTSKSNLTVALGKDISGQNICIDLAKMPHLLIAGSTGSGKSVCINTILMSILYKSSPEQVKLVLIDPKVVELSVYNGIPHLLVPVVTEAKKAAGALQWAVTEMMQRYKLFAEKNVRNFQGYNEKIEEGEKPLPQIVIVIDELADLMMVASGEVEDAICRLAQMARAAGMHLVIATQRPSADVLTGLIKANVPSRIAFAVSSSIDSRIILDQTGAEKLIGRGDMLYSPLGAPKPLRIQGGYVSDQEIEDVVGFIKEHCTGESNADEQSRILDEIEKRSKETVKGKKGITGSMGGTDPDGDYVDDGDDVLLPRAVELVLKAGMASTSGLQRSLGVGHSRAGRLMDQMEKKGYIGPYQGSKPRDVLITQDQWNEIRTTQGEESEE